MSTQEKFDLAVKVVQGLPKQGSVTPDQALQLKMYSYYKQATIGPCNIDQPWMVQVEARMKWDAWNALGDMSKDVAMQKYAEEFYQSLEGKNLDETPADIRPTLDQFVAKMKA